MTLLPAAPPGAACGLLDVRAYLGPGLHCDFPSVAGLVALGGGDRPDPLRLAGRLRELLAPFGANAGDDVGAAADGAVLARDDPATGIARCIAALAGYLEQMAGGRGYPAFGRAVAADRALAVFACDVRESGLEILRFAVSVVDRLLGPMPTESAGLRTEIAGFVQAAAALHLDPYAASLVDAAARRGIPAYRLAATGRFVQLGQGCRQRHFLETTSDAGSAVGVKLAANKPAALELLDALGLPVPEGGLAGSAEEARRLADRLGYPVVVKPTHGMSGKGVAVGLRNGDEAEAAGRAALALNMGSLRVEKHVAGHDFRLLVVGGRLVSVVRRTPAHVIGDGVQTVDELLLALNRSRRADPRGLLQQVARDAEADRQLVRQGLDFA
ncbi:MAG: acetate--CoA ligase family protein, partial [Rhodocyclaceae bacterium]|nr:acetate--CoA ligase family protein [Rhodocyclaceae bacterium]